MAQTVQFKGMAETCGNHPVFFQLLAHLGLKVNIHFHVCFICFRLLHEAITAAKGMINATSN